MSGRLVTPAPSVNEVNLLQEEKALVPKLVIFPLIVISVNLLQPEKAKLLIEVNVLGRDTEVKLLQL